MNTNPNISVFHHAITLDRRDAARRISSGTPNREPARVPWSWGERIVAALFAALTIGLLALVVLTLARH
jgi:hypothetical protein